MYVLDMYQRHTGVGDIKSWRRGVFFNKFILIVLWTTLKNEKFWVTGAIFIFLWQNKNKQILRFGELAWN